MAKLKVFTWSDGFHAFTVATTSRPKALAAWGIGADIFKSGLAREITAGPDHAAALRSPGEIIQRGEAVDPGKTALRKTPRPRPPSKAARRRVETLEADLAALDEARAAEEADIERRRAALEAEADKAGASYERARKALLQRLRTARGKL